MSRATRRARGSARSRRTPVPPRGAGRRLRIPWIPVVVVAGVAVVVVFVAYLIIQAGKPPKDEFGEAARIEADNNPELPGEWINLPEIYTQDGEPAFYGNNDGPNTANHVGREVDYSEQELPPAGGPHWAGGCADDPDESSPFCGPAPWGIYRTPWDAETLVHNMEHAGAVIWYNTADQEIIDQLEDFASDNKDKLLVLAPYPEMEAEMIAITVWSRRDKFPASEYNRDRLEKFMDELYCRFDPENFCR